MGMVLATLLRKNHYSANIFRVMSDTDRQNYELGYHISVNLDESEVQNNRQKLEETVTSHGGTISFSKDPERIRLAYPIKHQTSSYFAYLNFNLEPSDDSVAKIRDEIRLNPNIVRFLILKLQSEAKLNKEDLIRKMALAEKRRARIAKGVEKPAVQKGDVPKADEKEIEDKLEEILEKL